MAHGLFSIQANNWPPENFVFEYLRDNGSRDLNVNGASDLVNFDYTVPAGFEVVLFRVNILLMDTTVVPEDFGALSGDLSKGVAIQFLDVSGNVTLDPCAGQPILNNSHWSVLAGVDSSTKTGAGADALATRWTLEKAGAPVWMKAGAKLRFIVQDNLSTLILFRVMAQGLLLKVNG